MAVWFIFSKYSNAHSEKFSFVNRLSMRKWLTVAVWQQCLDCFITLRLTRHYTSLCSSQYRSMLISKRFCLDAMCLENVFSLYSLCLADCHLNSAQISTAQKLHSAEDWMISVFPSLNSDTHWSETPIRCLMKQITDSGLVLKRQEGGKT